MATNDLDEKRLQHLEARRTELESIAANVEKRLDAVERAMGLGGSERPPLTVVMGIGDNEKGGG